MAATKPERERGGIERNGEQKQNFNVTSHSDSDKLIGCPALPSIPQTDSHRHASRMPFVELKQD